MFELMNHLQGRFIIFAIILLVLSCVQSHEANKHINYLNELNADDYRKPKYQTAPYVPLIITIILLVVALVIPLSD